MNQVLWQLVRNLNRPTNTELEKYKFKKKDGSLYKLFNVANSYKLLEAHRFQI
jgi:hypothetical protein